MTTYSTSTIYDYTVALIAAIKAANPTATVTDGHPSSVFYDVGTVIWVGDVDGRQQYRALGNANRPREEEYEIECGISIVDATVPDQTDTHTDQANRAFAILAGIESALRANPTLGLDAVTPVGAAGGYVVYSEVGRRIQVQKRGNDVARETAVTFQVHVKAHL